MKKVLIMSGNIALAIGIMCMSFVVGYFAGTERMRQEAIERNLAAYCPKDAAFSWMKVIEPMEILMETTDCQE